ncbi:MAG: hypothetical protein K2K29_03955, partial [Muribaculaceae bacterium]|nr:hypothetical protein [Muribaculaceae bacterium]
AIVSLDPLAIPHAFTLENCEKIRMEAEINGWTPLVVPFDATTVTNPLNKNIQFKLLDDEKILEGNVIYTLADNTQNLKCVTSVKANTPVLMRLKEDSRITLEASDAKVPSTPSEVRADGKDFSLHAVYNTNSLPAGDVYVLNDNGSSFVPAEADEQENEEEEKKFTLSPFTVYATSPMAVAEIPTDLPKTLEDIMTGVENATVSELIITKENGVTVIYAPEAFDTNIYTADGKLVRSIRLEAGRNVITLPGSGIYVIADRKVII